MHTHTHTMAAKKKGLSMEEKVARVEEFFKERQEPFTMKELETSIPKAKGVIYQSVAECVTLLVAENRVQSEKIGVSLLFWHFTATATNNLVHTNDRLAAGIAGAEANRAALAAKLAAVIAEKGTDAGGPAASAEREALEAALAGERARERQLAAAVFNASACDAVTFGAVRAAAVRCRDLANRWTDNIFILEAAARRKAGVSAAEFRRGFGIPGDLEYIGIGA